MASGSSLDRPKLVLTLTHACNLRCPYCPLDKAPQGVMSPELALRSARLFLERHPRGPRTIKFFGGEPLLAFGVLRSTIEAVRALDADPDLGFFVSSNATLIRGEALAYFRLRPDVELALSGVLDPRVHASLPKVQLNIPIPPHLAPELGLYVARLLSVGVRRLNFLPGYYLRWSAPELAALEKGFRQAAGLIARAWERGEEVEVLNLDNWAPTPLYNHGMVVDPEGDVYPCNLVFAEEFRHLRPELKLGSVLEPEGIAWDRARGLDYGALLKDALEPEIHRSTYEADARLSAFVRELRRLRSLPRRPQEALA